MRLVWFPTWLCQNYNIQNPQERSLRCPYCPYGYDNGLIFNGQQTCGPQSFIDPKIMVTFLKTNRVYLGEQIEFSGGEPLLYPYLIDVLSSLPEFRWAITSNTSVVSTVKRLDESGILGKCGSWTASYHLLSNRDKEFASSVEILQKNNIKIPTTIVIAEETIEHIPRALTFLKKIGIQKIQCHIDAHRNVDITELTNRITALAPEVRIQYNAVHRTNVTCRINKELLAISPEGDIFPCVTILYGCHDIKNPERIPICRVSEHLDLKHDLPNKVEKCNLDCTAPCDFCKHVTYE